MKRILPLLLILPFLFLTAAQPSSSGEPGPSQSGVDLPGGKPPADGPGGPSAPPALLLQGSLEGTPAITAPCRPLEVRIKAWSAGNVPPTGGTLRLEIRSKGPGRIVYALRLPFVLEARTSRIDKIDLPRGEYMISLRGSAVDQRRGQRRDFVLAEQPLTVGDAVSVKRSAASFPRVLVWAGGDQSTPIEQALIEKMVREAFAEDPAYVAVVSSAAAFVAQALTGMFNEYLLVDIYETLDAGEALKHGLARGHGAVMFGSGDHSRLMAETFGFRFEQPSRSTSASLVVPAGSVLGLSGSLPLAGPTLVPERRSALVLASYADGRPAVLLDKVDGGRIMVLPFPLTRSALSSGISTIYSRLVREAVLATVPQADMQDDLVPVTLTVASVTGPVQARLTETLPPGAAMLWSNRKASTGKGTATFEMTADSDPKTVFYFFRPGKDGDRRSFTTVSTACGGEFKTQGKVE